MALQRVFRRCWKAARTRANIRASSAVSAGGTARRVRRITLLVTFGAGRKQWGGTSNSASVRQCHCIRTENAP